MYCVCYTQADQKSSRTKTCEKYEKNIETGQKTHCSNQENENIEQVMAFTTSRTQTGQNQQTDLKPQKQCELQTNLSRCDSAETTKTLKTIKTYNTLKTHCVMLHPGLKSGRTAKLHKGLIKRGELEIMRNRCKNTESENSKNIKRKH